MLTTDQQEKLKMFLVNRGLTFKPLLDEMVDHLSCEIEERIDEGLSFDESLHQVTDVLPTDHFHLIQKETMETINKQFSVSRGLSYLALLLLFTSLIFKTMHFQGSGELFLLSFVSIAASLLAGSLSGIYLNREKSGTVRVLAVIIGVILLLTGFGFSILHFPGANEIILLAVIVIITSLFVNTIYVYKNATGEGNLLTYLHEKYTPGIERFLLILLIPLIVNKAVTIVTKPVNDIGSLILLVVVFGAGLQFVAISWRVMEKDLTMRNSSVLTALIIAFCTLTLPFLSFYIPFEIRVFLIAVFSAISGWLAYTLEESPKKLMTLIMACFVPVLFFGWALIKWGILSTATNGLVFNFPIVGILLIGLFLSRKNEIMRTYMIISLASYLFEYPIH